MAERGGSAGVQLDRGWARVAPRPERTKGTTRWTTRRLSLDWTLPGLCLVGFFLGRATLFGELCPFATAFAVAVLYAMGAKGWWAVAAALLGQATVVHGTLLAQVILAVAAAGLMVRVVGRDAPATPWWMLAVLAGAPLVVIRAFFVAFAGNGSPYAYVAHLMEGLLAAALAFVMLQVLTSRSRPLTGEHFFYVLVIVAGVIAGAGDYAYQTVSLKGLLSKLTVLLAAALGGVGAGAAAGAVVGIIPGIAFMGTPEISGVYAFAGLAGGVGRRFGRLGVVTGFLLGSVVLAVFFNDTTDLAGALAEAGLASAVLLVLPRGWLNRLHEVLPTGALGGGVDDRVRELVRSRVQNWARMFSELSRTFARVSAQGTEAAEDKPLDETLHEVGLRVCSDCPLYRTCWQREQAVIGRHLLAVRAKLDAEGRIGPEDLPESIRKRCVRLKELAVALGCLYETYRVNQYWYRRLVENREVVAEHLKGVAGIMQNLSAELCATAERAELIDGRVRRKLLQLGILVNRLEAVPREDGRLEFHISRPACKGEMACRYVVAPVVSKVMGQPYTVSTTSCADAGEAAECGFVLRPALHYRVLVGVAQVGKGGAEVSGDTHSCLDLTEGKFVMLLSDGMGVGEQAAVESGTTVSLLEQLFTSGFGQEMAVSTVNSILLLRAPDETFATVDITIVDLYSGKAELVKIGAPPSFILRRGKVRVVSGSSPPAGILRDLEASSITTDLGEGDVIVMATDGLADCWPGVDKEAGLSEVIVSLGALSPQEMADGILRRAQEVAGGAAPDDITVLVGKVARLRSVR